MVPGPVWSSRRATAAAYFAAGVFAVSGYGTTAEHETETTIELRQHGITSQITYTSDGDLVTKQMSTTELVYSPRTIPDAESARELVEAATVKYDGIAGISHRVVYGETSLVETLVVDYATADIQELAAVEGALFDSATSAAGVISLQQTLAEMRELGFTELG